MAKVYDALRRAEQERQRRTTGEAPPVARVEWEPPGHRVRPEKHSFLKRWLTRRRVKATPGVGDLNKRRIVLLQPDSYVAEQYRTLRGRIDAVSAQRPMKTIVVTSCLPGEGKTTAAINLALVTAMSLGRRVLLVDCDLRRPRVNESLGITPEAGLAEVLTDQIDLEEAITKVEGVNLEVLGVRGRPANPSELLSSTAMRELIEDVAQRYDRVILDTPAAMGLPDAKAVSELSDGIVMVVRAGVTPQADVHATLEVIDRRRVLGLLLNGAEADQGRYGYAT